MREVYGDMCKGGPRFSRRHHHLAAAPVHPIYLEGVAGLRGAEVALKHERLNVGELGEYRQRRLHVRRVGAADTTAARQCVLLVINHSKGAREGR